MWKQSQILVCLILVFLTLGLSVTNSTENQFYKTTTPLSVPRQMYGSVVLGNYLYVIGGNIQGKGDDPEGYVKTVEMAYIYPNGTLGNWIQTTPLPQNRCYIHNCTLALNDIVYVVMGTEGKKQTVTNTIYWTRPQT